MKNYKYAIIVFLLITVLFSSCSNPINSKKSNKYYYTNLVAKHLVKDNKINGTVMDTNFYKEINLSSEDISTIKSFIKTLKGNNFINAPKDLPKKPEYKIYLNFQKAKYVINVYNEKYIAIYPWDGNFPMDYIDMTGVYLSNNLYGMCKNIFPKN